MIPPTVDLYPWLALASSAVLTLLFGWHARFAVRTYRHRPADDLDSSRRLLIALVLVVTGVGLVVSSLVAFSGDHTDTFIGLSLSRGALLVGAIVLTTADRQRR